MEAEDQVSSVQEGPDISTEEEKLLYEDEVTDQTPGAFSKPVSYAVRKAVEIGEEDDLELAKLRIEMKQTNKRLEETFKLSEKERLKQDILQKKTKIEKYEKKENQSDQLDQLYNPKRRASFIKFGSEPNQIENLLFSKVKCFFDKPNKEVIKHVVKHTVLRENTTGHGKLDKRRSSNTRIFEKSLIPNKSDCPNKLVADTLNKRGVTRFDNYWKHDYHEAQGILFQSLKALDLFALPDDIRVEGGYLKRDATTITTAEFCDVVDDVTERFMKRYSSDLIPIENIHMHAVYESCEKICIERLLMDMAIQNDMLDFKSYQN